jgi:alpha-beta hydrolase superfamily lysophospholipase
LTAPIFVIHGVGNRDPEAFGRAVDTLAGKVGITAHPVYWGDLGAKYELITRTVPGAPDEVRDSDEAPLPDLEALAQFLLAESGPSGAEIRGDDAVPELVLQAAAEAVSGVGAEEVRGEEDGGDADAVRQALVENWVDMTWLPLVDDAELQRAIGAAVAGAIADEAASLAEGEEVRCEELRGLDIGGFVRRRLHEIDHVVGATTNVAAGRLNTHMRTSFLPGFARAFGDILVYQRDRDAIQECVRDAIATIDPGLGRSAERPIDVIGHSLGGVIAVDIATSDDPLWIRRLVTFGSQSSFFHVCDPRGGLIKPYGGEPVVLPESIGAWTNLWEPLDPLAFVAAPIFRLHNGGKVQDVQIAHLASSGLWTHSVYWKLDDVVRNIREALVGPT